MDSFVAQWTVAHQALLSMGFPWQEYWSGLTCPPPGDLPNPRTEPMSPALGSGFFTTEPPGKPCPTPGNARNTSCWNFQEVQALSTEQQLFKPYSASVSHLGTSGNDFSLQIYFFQSASIFKEWNSILKYGELCFSKKIFKHKQKPRFPSSLETGRMWQPNIQITAWELSICSS